MFSDPLRLKVGIKLELHKGAWGGKMNKNLAFDFLLKAAGLTLLSVAMISVLHPSIRNGFRTLLVQQDRQILSTASGNILHNGMKTKVLKIKEANKLYLEIYGNNSKSQKTSLLGRIPLNTQKDAYFTFKGVATNLALDDIDGDKKLEILVPGYDSNLMAHMNVYRYDSNQNIFLKVNPNKIQATKERAIRR